MRYSHFGLTYVQSVRTKEWWVFEAALREYLDGKAPRFEDALRRIIREELKSNADYPPDRPKTTLR
jgi:hypothetical protein